MATLPRTTQNVTHYAYYGELYGTAELLNGAAYLFREEGQRQAVVVSYKPMVLVCYKPYNIIELYKLRVHVFELAVVLRFFHADILAHPTLRGEPYVHRGVYHRVVL
jgi:hypothetical protein